MRVKRGIVKKRKHKSILAQTKGFRMSYSKLYRRAREAVLHAGKYSFAHRKKRPGQFRQTWIKRINAVCKQNSTSYSRFMNALKVQGIKLDRKILAYLAYNHKSALTKLVTEVSK